MRKILISALALLTLVIVAHAQALTDKQIADRIIADSRQAFHTTGGPCACPDDQERNGSRCGSRSAYRRPGGVSPKCFLQDVMAPDLAAYRARH
jgi:hypothetical protein